MGAFGNPPRLPDLGHHAQSVLDRYSSEAEVTATASGLTLSFLLAFMAISKTSSGRRHTLVCCRRGGRRSYLLQPLPVLRAASTHVDGRYSILSYLAI